MTENLYYLQDSRGCAGTRIMFWAIDGKGYTSNINAAHVYSESKARSMNNNRDTDIPLLKSIIDAAAEKTLDHQNIEKSTKTPAAYGHGFFYLMIDNRFDGNDVVFFPSTTSLIDAKKYCEREAQELINRSANLTAVHVNYAESIARLSVGYSNTLRDEAAMPNLKKPEKIKIQKELYNCISCGKFFSPPHQYAQNCTRCGNP
jgi:hypothetical protein